MNSDNQNMINDELNKQEQEFHEMMNIFSHNQNKHCKDKDGSTNEKNQKQRRKLSSILVTKSEGFAMWIILLLLVVVCSVTMQRSMASANIALSERVGNLEYQVQALLVSNNALSAKLEAYLNADEPINITINVDGKSEDFIYDSDSGELVKPDEDQGFDTRPFLGVGFFENDEAFDSPLGLKVDYVYEYSPAASSGIKPGDVLLSIDGTKLTTFDDLNAVISSHAADDIIKVQIATTSENGVDVVDIDVKLTFRGNFDFGDNE